MRHESAETRETQKATTALEPEIRPKVDVQTLLGGKTEVLLDHAGVEYRLRVTRQGKLLLTK